MSINDSINNSSIKSTYVTIISLPGTMNGPMPDGVVREVASEGNLIENIRTAANEAIDTYCERWDDTRRGPGMARILFNLLIPELASHGKAIGSTREISSGVPILSKIVRKQLEDAVEFVIEQYQYHLNLNGGVDDLG